MLTSNACYSAAGDARFAARRTGSHGDRGVQRLAVPINPPTPSGASRSLVTPTTQIAGAGVLGNDRKPDESCARDAAAADPGPPTRPAHNAAGVTPDVAQVPADPQRIVVLSGDQLDALCALGLQSRVSPPRCPTVPPVSPHIWARRCTACPASAPAAPPTCKPSRRPTRI